MSDYDREILPLTTYKRLFDPTNTYMKAETPNIRKWNSTSYPARHIVDVRCALVFALCPTGKQYAANGSPTWAVLHFGVSEVCR